MDVIWFYFMLGAFGTCSQVLVCERTVESKLIEVDSSGNLPVLGSVLNSLLTF